MAARKLRPPDAPAAELAEAPGGDGAQPLPACHPGMFTGLLGKITEQADPGTEADRVGVYASLLAVCGTVIGNVPHVRIGNTKHPLLIWPLLIGRTNTGRKGEATGTAMRVMDAAASATVAEITESGLSSGEGLIERIRDPRDAEDEGGTDNKRLLVIETEFATVMEAWRREGNRLPGILRQAWSGERLSSLTKKRAVASYSHIAIIGHITPREFRGKIREADLAGGTYNRFLPIYVERRKMLPLPQGLSDAQLEVLAQGVSTAIARANWRTEIGLDEGAEKLWSGTLYREFTEFDDDSAVADFVQRAAPYCRRIAALYAVLDQRNQATEDDLEAAAHLIRYSIASAKFVLDPSPRDIRLDKLRRAVDEAGGDGLDREAIRRVFGGHLSKVATDELIGRLTSDGTYAQSTVSTAGRPRTVLTRVVTALKAQKAS